MESPDDSGDEYPLWSPEEDSELGRSLSDGSVEVTDDAAMALCDVLR